MKGHLRGLVLWALVAAASLAIGNFVDPYKNLLWALLPTTLFHLESGWWAALGMTACAAIAAWLCACVVGYTLGLAAAALQSSQGTANIVKRIAGRSLDQVYRYLYIVPFVLIVSISFGVFYPLCVDTVSSKAFLPKWCLWAWMVFASGVTLGGYRVFRAVFASVQRAKWESEVLVHGLHTPRSRSWVVNRLRPHMSRVLRLTDCDIASLAEAIEQAFLLAVVAIMVVEAVIPGIHEYLAPQRGSLPDWARGAGGLVVRQQANLQIAQVSGVLWAVIIFDTIMLHAISLMTSGLWMRHYHRSDEEATT